MALGIVVDSEQPEIGVNLGIAAQAVAKQRQRKASRDHDALVSRFHLHTPDPMSLLRLHARPPLP